MLLNSNNTTLVLIDVQEKLEPAMHERETLVRNLTKLVQGMKSLQIPVFWLEQTPDKLGRTIPALRSLLEPATPFTKNSFSCGGCTSFTQALAASGRRQVLIAGIETHVCVYQTAVALIRDSYAVEVVADAVSSRRPLDHAIGLEKIRDCGRHSVGSGQGHMTTVETALFELMRTAGHERFRDILKIVK